MNIGIYKEKGITLIALVITIIILLILAGVTISLLTGNNGILSQAKVSKEKDKIGKIEEEVKLLYEDAIIKEKLDKNINKVIVLEENLKKEDENARVITANEQVVALYKDYVVIIDDDNITVIDKSKVNVNWEEAKVLVIDDEINGFENVLDAVAEANNRKTCKILLLDNIETNLNRTIKISGKNIKFDLNGFSIENTYGNYILTVEAEVCEILNGSIKSMSAPNAGGINIMSTNKSTKIANIEIESKMYSLVNSTSGKTILESNFFKGNLYHNHAQRNNIKCYRKYARNK